MSLIILHVSDLHISDRRHVKPAELVVAALREVHESVDAAAILITGDIASSGQKVQYMTATDFVQALKDGISRELGIGSEVIAIPGNHDCAFPQDSAVRDLVVKEARSAGGHVQSDNMLRECLGVQDHFFEWLTKVTNLGDLADSERLCWTTHFDLPNDRRVATLCLNTAWMSTLKEQQGGLLFPIASLREPPTADLVISLLHHPYNWFDATNARQLRHTLQASSGLVVTGHEHEAGAYTLKSTGSISVEYVEGHLFGNPEEKGDCGFNLLLCDLENSQYQVRHFSWEGAHFACSSRSAEWTVFGRNAQRTRSTRSLTDDMRRFLDDPGAQFTHHAKAVELEDIFVTPNLRRLGIAKGPDRLRREIVESEFVVNRLFDEKNVHFSGDNESGKTSLAKVLFQQSLQRHLTPVLLRGADVRSPESKRLAKLIHNQLRKQYGNLNGGDFDQLDKDVKVIIVDDFANVPLNKKGKASVCQWLREKYGYVFIFGGDLTQLEEFVMDKEIAKGLAGYSYYEIMEFGHRLREGLIRKWLSIGRPYAFDSDEFIHQLTQAANIVDTILGKNLVPSYPIFVLAILQQIEAHQPVDTRTGAYGYFYEVLITAALHRTSRSADDIDMKYTYLAELAWHLFRGEGRELDTEELRGFNEEHWSKYRLPDSADSVCKQLANSRILVLHGDRASFAYSYIYYYFVARHMRDNLSEPEVQEVIETVVENLHREDCANVIIFLTYLSKDKGIIGRVLCTAREMFKEKEPCDLDAHVEFLNRLQERVPEIVLLEGDVDEHRNEVLRQKDRTEIASAKSAAIEPGTETEQDNGFQELLGLNRALKSVQIMGQILRNFSGSLSGQLKVELARECFATGLRALTVVLGGLERNVDALVKIFAEILGKRIEEVPQQEKENVAREVIFFLSEMLCFAMIKRISSAVGSERLTPTYEDVRREYDNKATQFVQTAIRLDHNRHFPEKRVTQLMESVRKNVFGETLLRLLVAEHFYLFPRPFRVRQRVCAKLGIAPKKGMLLPGPTRKRAK